MRDILRVVAPRRDRYGTTTHTRALYVGEGTDPHGVILYDKINDRAEWRRGHDAPPPALRKAGWVICWQDLAGSLCSLASRSECWVEWCT